MVLSQLPKYNALAPAVFQERLPLFRPGTRNVDKVAISREQIAATHELIRPYVRRTPVIEVDGADFGLSNGPIACKLELLQHAGSFKARGAFANLLTRPVPSAGVVAASGGNHGLAVAFAAQKLGVPATIFVPIRRRLPAKHGAHPQSTERGWYSTGERYADALAASRRACGGSRGRLRNPRLRPA